jgi:hypothetical protein
MKFVVMRDLTKCVIWVWPCETFHVTLTWLRELRMKIQCCANIWSLLRFNIADDSTEKWYRSSGNNNGNNKIGVAECARNWYYMLLLLLYCKINQAGTDLLIKLCLKTREANMKCTSSSWFIWRIGKLVLVNFVQARNLLRTSVLIRLN